MATWLQLAPGHWLDLEQVIEAKRTDSCDPREPVVLDVLTTTGACLRFEEPASIALEEVLEYYEVLECLEEPPGDGARDVRYQLTDGEGKRLNDFTVVMTREQAQTEGREQQRAD